MRGLRFFRPLKAIAVVAAIVAFAGVLMAGLLYVRLLHGPISVAFLTQPIERAIAEEVAGVHVAIESVDLRLADGGQVEFELKNVRVTDSGGVPLVIAPSASVSLSRKALLRARIAPESVDLISPRLSLFYGEDGTLALKFATAGRAPPRASAPSCRPRRGSPETPPPARRARGMARSARIDLVKMLSETSARARRREHASAYLREIGLKSATVVIDQGGRKSVWSVPELGIDLDHRRSRSQIAGRAKIEIAGRALYPQLPHPRARDPRRPCNSPSPSRASCRAAWRGRCRRWRAWKASTCRCGAMPASTSPTPARS